MLGTYDITTIRASMGMYLVLQVRYMRKPTCAYSSRARFPTSCSAISTPTLLPTPEEFQREAKKRVDELHMYDVLRADRCISVNSLEARVPFGDLDFVRVCHEHRSRK